MLRLTKFRQQFDNSCLADWDQALPNELFLVQPLIRPETHIAIAIGSRGITHRPQIAKSTVEFVKSQGALPFIVPAMQSHHRKAEAGAP